MKILVVEDDRIVVQSLQFLLSSYNYAVDIAADGEEALRLADAFEYHLVLLDVLLPRLSGIEVCRQLRKKGFRQPILLLTGQGETQQKAIALNTGADDYVVKPFDNDELIARIQALLRRGGTAGEPILTWDHLSLDPNTLRVAYQEQILVLTPKEFAILELFLRHQETVFSARTILDLAWKSVESPGEEAVRCHIKDLRQKLMAVGAPKDLIKTVYRVGYRLNPLYAASTPVQENQSPSATQIAELRAVNEELRVAMEQLRSTQAELEQKNQELQAARDAVEQQVADRTAELQVLYDQAPCGFRDRIRVEDDRKQAEVALCEREALHRTLFNSIDEGVCLFERLPLRPDGLRDYRYLAMNPTMQAMFGIPDLSGQSIRDNFPDEVEDWYDDYDRVLETGESIRFERESEPQGMVLEMFVTRVEDESGRRLLAVMKNVTERKRREANLAFLADIGETCSRLSSAEDIVQAVGEKVGDYLNIVACNFCEIDEAQDQVIYFGRWQSVGEPPLPSKICLSEQVSEEFCRRARAGETIVSHNTQTNPVTQAEANAAIGALSFITVPFHKDGDWKYLFSIHDHVPRTWQNDEIELVQELANRLFPRLERARAEEALRNNEELLRLALMGAKAGSWEWDLITEQFHWSEENFRLHGLNPTDGEPSYDEWCENLVHPDDREWVKAYGEKVLEQRLSTINLEFRILHPQEGVRWLLSLGHLICNEQGKPIRLNGINLDISDRKNAEIALVQREAQMNRILNNAGAVIGEFSVYADRTYVHGFYSVGCETVFGYSQSEMMGDSKLWLSRVLPEDVETVIMPGYEQIFAEKNFTIEYRFQDKTNTIRWISETLTSRWNEAAACWYVTAIAIDISDRKQTTIALQQSEAKFRHFAENSHAVIWIADPISLNCTYVSPAYEAIWGRSCQSLLDAPKSWLDAIHPDERDQVEAELRQKRQENASSIEYRIVRPDGTIRWIQDRGFTVRDETGQIYSYAGIAEDISDRKQTEIALHQREAFLDSIYNGAAQTIFVVEVTETNDFRYLDFNYLGEQMSGRTTSYLKGKTPEEAYGRETGASFRQNYERCLQVGTGITYEEYISLEHSSFWALTTLSPLRDEHGRIYRIVGTAIDISDRKQAELTLQKQIQQEYLLNDIAQEIRRSLNLNDVLSSTVHRVRAFLEVDRVVLFRFRPDWQGDVIMESVGDEWTPILSTTIFDPCFHDHYIEPYRQGRVATMSDIDAADLEPCYVELLQQFQVKANLVVPILQNDHLWGLLIAHHCTAPRQWTPTEIALLQRLATQVGIAIQQSELYQQIQLELDDRKQAEQKIREQAALLDISTDAILVCDLDCRILYWNQGAEHLYGWQAEEVLGQKANELLLRSPSAFVEMKQTVLEQGMWHGEIQRFTKTGKEVTVEGRCTLVRDEAGQPKSILSVDTDITEKKSLEAQFYQAQRLESLGTLTSGIAHDLNNALTPILSIAQLLRMKQSELDARSKEMLQVLEESAQRGANMVKQILTFTRGTGGEKTAVDVASLLQEVVKVAQQTFPKSITIRAIVSPEGIRQVSADATQLHQVLMNLCVNARDAMPTGGALTLSVENFDANEIFAQMNLDAHVGQYVLITVTDTGTGITPEVRDRIFDPFFTTKAIGQGTGLGLSTVLGIVKSYDGFIEVDSEVGKGTQFKVYLPAIETEAASRFQETTLPQGQGELILVVDDESPILQSTRVILETHHYQVLTARGGTEAIALYAQHQQDIALVLVDMMMPDMDGAKVIRVLQEMNPQARAIAVSGLLPQYQNSLESLGITTYLNKPYTTEDLLNSIHLQLLPEARNLAR